MAVSDIMLSKKGTILKASIEGLNSKDLYNDDDDILEHDKIILEMQSNCSEESKRRENSLKSNLSKEGLESLNSVLSMLEKLTDENSDKVIMNLKVNVYALKTALMTPIDIFVENHSDHKCELATYLKYTEYDELFGLFLVIKNKNTKVFKFLWEERGTLWSEKHLLPVVEEIVKYDWDVGLKEFFNYDRTHEIFTSMYCNERRNFYEKLSLIADNLLSKNTEKSLLLLESMMKGLAVKPYATLTFINMFKYIHITKTRIRTHDIDPPANTDDLFVIIYK